MNRKIVSVGLLVAVTGSFSAVSASAQGLGTGRSPAAPQAAPAARPPAPAPPPSIVPRAAETAIKGDEVIARVGTTDVSAEEMRAAIATLDARQQATLAHDPALLSQTVRALLANRLVLKEALSKKWEQRPAVAAQLDHARDNLIAESYLQSIAAPPDNFPTDAEIKAVYDANASALVVPRRFQLAQMLVALAKDADKAAEDKAGKRLADVVKKLKQPRADFAAIAKSDSDDAASAERGGEIGWLAEAELRPEIRSQVAGLSTSALTDPIRLDDGWHVLKLLDTQAAHPAPLADVREALVQRMRAERADATRRAYLAELLKQTPPVINELALSKLLAAPGAPSPADK